MDNYNYIIHFIRKNASWIISSFVCGSVLISMYFRDMNNNDLNRLSMLEHDNNNNIIKVDKIEQNINNINNNISEIKNDLTWIKKLMENKNEK